MVQIKDYLIIGASSEVGTAFIKLLEEKEESKSQPTQVRVTAHYGSRREVLEELGQSLKWVKLTLVQTDLSRPEEVERLLQETETAGIPGCIVWLAAGKLEYRKLKKLDWEKTKVDLEIQVHALALTGARLLPLMARRRYGKMVVMLSECTLGMPPRFMTEYVTVKYAAAGLMKAMSLEYADKGINVNGISPGMMETGFLSNVDDRLIAMNAEASVKKRNAKVEEAAEGIYFLCSAGSDYMNGVNLNLSGGNR